MRESGHWSYNARQFPLLVNNRKAPFRILCIIISASSRVFIGEMVIRILGHDIFNLKSQRYAAFPPGYSGIS